MKSGIYIIENVTNGKRYVGQGGDVEKRMMASHKECKVLNGAILKYGLENFTRYVLEYCSIEILDERETYYIKELNSHITEWGYNVLKEGFSRRGIPHSKETIAKLSIAHSSISDETRQKMRLSKLGTTLSEETKLKIGKGNEGKIVSQETINKIRRTGKDHFMFGKNHKKETIEKMSIKSSNINNSQYGVKNNNSSSLYHGVNWYKDGEKWKSWLNINKQKIHLGYYNSEIEAATSYDVASIVYYNESANLNFPELRENYISYLQQYDIQNTEDLRKIIKNYIANKE